MARKRAIADTLQREAKAFIEGQPKRKLGKGGKGAVAEKLPGLTEEEFDALAKRPDITEAAVLTWVAKHFTMEGLKPLDAPSLLAWVRLEWARGTERNGIEFWREYNAWSRKEREFEGVDARDVVSLQKLLKELEGVRGEIEAELGPIDRPKDLEKSDA